MRAVACKRRKKKGRPLWGRPSLFYSQVRELELYVGTDGDLREVLAIASNTPIIRIAEGDCAAESHAGAVGVAAANRETLNFEVLSEYTAMEAIFHVCLQPACANMVWTIVPTSADNPSRGVAIVGETVVGVFVCSTKAEALECNVCTNVPCFHVIRYTGNFCFIRSIRVASTEADAEAFEFAIPTGSGFPQVFVIASIVIYVHSLKVVADLIFASFWSIRNTSLEAAEFRRQIGQTISVLEICMVVFQHTKSERCCVFDALNVSAQTVNIAVSRRSSNLQQVSSAIFCTEVDTAPAARTIKVSFVGCVIVKTKGIFYTKNDFIVRANRQTSVCRGFAGEVDFSVLAEVKLTKIASSRIIVRVNAVTTEKTTEVKIDFSRSGSRDHRCANKCGTCEKYFFHCVSSKLPQKDF